MYFTCSDHYHYFLVFVPILRSLTLANKRYRQRQLDIDKSITKKVKPFGSNSEPAMSNSVSGNF